ncbi:MAG: nicotinate-nucleotide adenylyltransferase [Anaerolineae bacterium]
MGGLARLGVLGGTFDPIHIGHLLMAQTAYDALGLDLVLFVPAGKAPHRQLKDSLDAQTRVAMVAAAIADDERFALSTVDVGRPAPHYTADTLALLSEEYGLTPDSLHFIVGSDSLAMLPTWRHPELVVSRCRLAVMCRPGYPIDLAALVEQVPEARGRVDLVEMPAVGISSTLLRHMVRNGQSVRYWIPAAVERMVHEAGFYRSAVEADPAVSGQSH